MKQATTTANECGDLFARIAPAGAVSRARPPIQRRRPLEMEVAGALCRQLRRKQVPQEKRRIAHLICLNLLSLLKQRAQ